MFSLQNLTFFSLGMCLISFWIHRSIWLWISFLAIACTLAIQSGIAKPFCLVPIGTLFTTHLILKYPIEKWMRMTLFFINMLISLGLIFHLIPGFNNLWKEAAKFWINFDQPFIGLFVLAFQLPLLRSSQEWIKMAIKTVPLTIAGVAVLHFAFYFGHSFHIPPAFSLHLIVNLLFVTIPQEGFFRGFVQRELFQWMGSKWIGHVGAVALTSLFVTALQLYWNLSPLFLSFVFVANLIYGFLYQYTKAIESSIFCHFVINILVLTLNLSH